MARALRTPPPDSVMDAGILARSGQVQSNEPEDFEPVGAEPAAVEDDSGHLMEVSPAEVLSGDLLSIYVREVASHALLTADEEKRLTQELLRHRLSMLVLLAAHPMSLDALLAFVSSNLDFFRQNQEWRDWSLRNPGVEDNLVSLFRDHAKTLPRLISREQLADLLALQQSLHQAAQQQDQQKMRRSYRQLMRQLVSIQFPHELMLTLCQALRDQRSRRTRRPLTALVPITTEILLHKLERRLARFDLTKRKLVQANLRLVVFIAQKHRYGGLQLHDMVQEGNLGLLKAADKFDYRKGFRFATYAYWWIQQQIKLAIKRQSDLVVTPIYFQDEANRFQQSNTRMQQENGRQMSVSEVSRNLDVAPERAAVLARGTQRVLSIERPIGADNDTLLRDVLPDHNVESPGQTYLNGQRQQQVQQLLEKLTQREARVMSLRFGIGIYQEYTLREVAQQIGVSPERVRQIEREAIAKLQQLAGGNLRHLLAD